MVRLDCNFVLRLFSCFCISKPLIQSWVTTVITLVAKELPSWTLCFTLWSAMLQCNLLCKLLKVLENTYTIKKRMMLCPCVKHKFQIVISVLRERERAADFKTIIAALVYFPFLNIFLISFSVKLLHSVMMGAWIFQFPDICTASSDIAGTRQDLIVFCY